MARRKLKLTAIVTDAGTQIRVAIDPDVVAEYAADMAKGDKFPPIVVFKDGGKHILADGFHRVRAAEHNEATDILADLRKGGRRDALKYALSANVAHGLRRTNADKRRCVELALAEWPRLSDREIARLCGVNHETVGGVRPQLAESASCPETRLGADGKERRLPQRPEGSGIKIASWNEEPDEDDITNENRSHRTIGTGFVEWFTPAEEVEKVRRVLGKIDLDPASCETAQATVRADQYFDEKANGLVQEWKSRVFMNPPYARQLIDRFAAKALEEIEAGRTKGSYKRFTIGTTKVFPSDLDGWMEYAGFAFWLMEFKTGNAPLKCGQSRGLVSLNNRLRIGGGLSMVAVGVLPPGGDMCDAYEAKLRSWHFEGTWRAGKPGETVGSLFEIWKQKALAREASEAEQRKLKQNHP